ncbi:MAG TPA: hypothetical protein VK427_21810 [Kofleriaceae bacterium]|nr:hypothetical protein [Kofleriaceae bacterium]
MRALLPLVVLVILTGCYDAASSRGGGQVSAARAKARAANPQDIEVPPGYRVELVADRLSFPTGIAFGDGRTFVVESGYAYGEVLTKPRLLELVAGGVKELATGDGAPWNGVAYHDGALYVAHGGALTGGRIVRYDLAGNAKVLVEGLPSLGDHHTNGPVVADGWIYFGQGTVTNAGVVGPDAAEYGWLARHPKLHDTPCEDITLAGRNWKSGAATTGAYHAFGTSGPAGEVVRGALPCNGAVMRIPVAGGPLELVAWGFRNPFGLAVDGRGDLYVTDNAYDMRGSRPIYGVADVIWHVERGRWYGWPDFAEGRAVTRDEFAESDGDPGGFVLSSHPRLPPEPVAQLAVHAAAVGFDFSRSARFGHVGSAFVALFGDMAPTTGKVMSPVGFKVVRVDLRTHDVEDFARNRGDAPGPATKKQQRGLERPIAARFDPSGDALYIVDFGIMRLTDKGPAPQPNTGRIWRITRAR